MTRVTVCYWKSTDFARPVLCLWRCGLYRQKLRENQSGGSKKQVKKGDLKSSTLLTNSNNGATKSCRLRQRLNPRPYQEQRCSPVWYPYFTTSWKIPTQLSCFLIKTSSSYDMNYVALFTVKLDALWVARCLCCGRRMQDAQDWWWTLDLNDVTIYRAIARFEVSSWFYSSWKLMTCVFTIRRLNRRIYSNWVPSRCRTSWCYAIYWPVGTLHKPLAPKMTFIHSLPTSFLRQVVSVCIRNRWCRWRTKDWFLTRWSWNPASYRW